uniref:C2H2-type domain-containing protein n=1 Tax=Ditylenchus dipsaci TaxID=166011 RepID=A0A915D1N9_9BILA
MVIIKEDMNEKAVWCVSIHPSFSISLSFVFFIQWCLHLPLSHPQTSLCLLLTCSGQLFSVPELKKHFDECHTALKLYGCHCCGKGFANRAALVEHSCFLFSQFMVVSMIRNIQEANFHREYSSLICSKCGLQIDLKFLSENLDHQQMDHLVRQFQDCLLAHSPQDFILCTVHMFQEANCEERFLKLVFMSEQPNSASVMTDNEALCLYIQEAFRIQEDPKCNQKSDCSQRVSIRSKKVDHSNITPTVYSLRVTPNTYVNYAVEHMADKHLDQLGKIFGSYNVRLFNAQSQFKRIDLGGSNYKYECKVCGHLTKMNIKPSALSQHFKDRHPEVRAQAAFSFASRMLGFSESGENSPTNNQGSSGINQSAIKGLILDKHILGPAVFRFTDLPHQGIHCFICGDLSHCSLLSFGKHLANTHSKQFYYDLNKHVDIFEMASKVRKIICGLKVADESELIQSIGDDFLENDLQMFDVKQEGALCLFRITQLNR